MDIYLQKGGQKYGPLSEDQIRQGIDEGVVSADDLACTSEDGSWQPISGLIGSTLSKKSTPNRWMIVLRWLFWNRRPPTRGDRVCTFVILAILLISGIVKLSMDAHFAKEGAKQKEVVQHIYGKLPGVLTWDANGKPAFPPFTPSHPTQYPSVPSPRATPPDISTLPAPMLPTPGLWSSEEDFKRCYGEPAETSHNPPSEPDVFIYGVNGFITRVAFWNGSAQFIGIVRTDLRPLTEGTIDERLDSLADKQDWSREKDEGGKPLNVWVGNNAVASLSPFPDKEPTTNCLKIWSKEYFREYDRLNTFK